MKSLFLNLYLISDTEDLVDDSEPPKQPGNGKVMPHQVGMDGLPVVHRFQGSFAYAEGSDYQISFHLVSYATISQSEIGWNVTENYGWWAVPTLQQLSRSQTVAKALIGET